MYVIYDPPQKKKRFAKDHKSLWTPWKIGSVDLINFRQINFRSAGDWGLPAPWAESFSFWEIKGVEAAGENVTFSWSGGDFGYLYREVYTIWLYM